MLDGCQGERIGRALLDPPAVRTHHELGGDRKLGRGGRGRRRNPYNCCCGIAKNTNEVLFARWTSGGAHPVGII